MCVLCCVVLCCVVLCCVVLCCVVCVCVCVCVFVFVCVCVCVCDGEFTCIHTDKRTGGVEVVAWRNGVGL